ncbi:MAG TPA: hypothetical protein VF698_08190 [Thermoanaerobaculia bacterium]|jgi:hypothetical protein
MPLLVAAAHGRMEAVAAYWYVTTRCGRLTLQVRCVVKRLVPVSEPA